MKNEMKKNKDNEMILHKRWMSIRRDGVIKKREDLFVGEEANELL